MSVLVFQESVKQNYVFGVVKSYLLGVYIFKGAIVHISAITQEFFTELFFNVSKEQDYTSG